MPDDTKQRDDLNKVLFMNLVMMLASSAMQQMGKLVNPMTGKAEVSLEGAQVTIDILTMLQAKAKGNLDKHEEKMLVDLLTSLQLNYVATAEAAASGDTTEAPAVDQPAESDTKTPPASHPTDTDAKKDPKFRKSYGA